MVNIPRLLTAGGHCARCGGFLDAAGECHNPRCGTFALAGGAILGAVDTDDEGVKGICPKCGATLSVGDGEEDWCTDCMEMVTSPSTAVAGHIRALGDKDADADIGPRWEAAVALGEIGDPAAVPALAQALETNTDIGTRYRAAEALGKIIGGAAAVGALLKSAADDEDENIRWRAAEALGKIGGAAAVGALKSVADDEDEEDGLRRRARGAIDQIQGTAK